MHRFPANGVGKDPVGSAGDFRRQVAVAGANHVLGGGCSDVEVEQHHGGCRAGHGDLHALAGHGGAEAGVAVHRGGRAEHGVGLFELAGGEFDQVVERPGPDRDTDSALFAQPFPDGFSVFVGGVEGGRAGKDQRVGDGHPGVEQGLLDGLAGGRPCAFVGHHQHGPAVSVQVFGDDRTGARQHASADLDDSGLVGVGESLFDCVVHARASIRSVSSCCNSCTAGYNFPYRRTSGTYCSCRSGRG